MATSTLAASVSQLAELGKAKNPQLSARFDRAAAIVLAGEYQTTSDPDTLLIHGYHVNGHCECKDFELGHAPTAHNGKRYCKHMLAKAMVLRLASDPEPVKQVRSESPNAWAQGMAWRAFAQSYKH